MSSLLEQAIIDATALKQAATKTAEKNLIDKYSHKIKEAVDKLLEQDMNIADPALDPNADSAAAGGPMDAASSLENMPSDLNDAEVNMEAEGGPEDKKDPLQKIKNSFMLDGKDDELITIDFSSLKAKPVSPMGASPVAGAVPAAPTGAAAPIPPAAPAAPMEEGLDLDEDEDLIEEKLEGSSDSYGEDGINEEFLDDEDSDDQVTISLEEDEMCEGGDCGGGEPVVVALGEDTYRGGGESVEDLEENEDLDEEEDVELEESLIVDIENVSDGWRGTYASERQQIENIKLAKMQDEEVQLKMKEYQDAVESAFKKIKRAGKEKEVLMKENMELKHTLSALKEHIEKMNLSNAKLLYVNRALGNNSFNERQKQQIVETISKAESVEGAKIAFETLQSSVQSAKPSVKAPKSLNEAVSRSSSPFLVRNRNQENNPMTERMKALAGIK